eukprot:868778-Pyramimonas_sp.AAC.1
MSCATFIIQPVLCLASSSKSLRQIVGPCKISLGKHSSLLILRAMSGGRRFALPKPWRLDDRLPWP